MTGSGEEKDLYDLGRSRKKDILSRIIQHIVKTLAITRHGAIPSFLFILFYLCFSLFDSAQNSASGRILQKRIKA